ncbi:hypothetical protein B5M45_24780 [Mycobacterium simiae]|uniref:Transcriptional regulator WhiB n=1 Tax=Mycobacterium simiae TaxID=1784 RepID=A0A1X0XRT0_MYCSI|nr:hypothetical protein B5M45_24780 [Mycobacterium simiae]
MRRDQVAGTDAETGPAPLKSADKPDHGSAWAIVERWQDRALCATADPDVFFPDDKSSASDAKSLCLRCGVRDECLEYALEHDERFGIWGGLSARERRQRQLEIRRWVT